MGRLSWQTAISISDLPGALPVQPIRQATIKESSEDFVVYEIPRTMPSGTGQHLFLWVRKQGVSGGELVNYLSAALHLHPHLIGIAGTKDKQAITYQWVSIPRDHKPILTRLTHPDIAILSAVPNDTKLKTGFLYGNRFLIRLRHVEGMDISGLSNAIQTMKNQGFPNLYGHQRFSREGSTLSLGLSILENPKKARRMPPFIKRMALSSVQSALFNLYCKLRWEMGLGHRVVKGDVLFTKRGGIFWTDDPVREQERLDAGEVFLTGPIFGPKMFQPRFQAASIEKQVLEAMDFDMDSLKPFKKLAPGTRRRLSSSPQSISFAVYGQDTVELSFILEAGSYATVMIKELVKNVLQPGYGRD